MPLKDAIDALADVRGYKGFEDGSYLFITKDNQPLILFNPLAASGMPQAYGYWCDFCVNQPA